MRLIVHKGIVVAGNFWELIGWLAEGMRPKIYLAAHGPSILKTGKAQKYIITLGAKITLLFLPPYSREFDADGRLRKPVK